MEGYTSPEMRKLRQAHMLHFGRIRKEMGMESLHLEDQLEIYLKVLAAHSSNLRRMRRRQAERATAAALSGKPAAHSAGKIVPQSASRRYSVTRGDGSGSEASASPAAGSHDKP